VIGKIKQHTAHQWQLHDKQTAELKPD